MFPIVVPNNCSEYLGMLGRAFYIEYTKYSKINEKFLLSLYFFSIFKKSLKKKKKEEQSSL